MATQEITLNLPEPIYDQLRQAAERSHRSIDDLIIEVYPPQNHWVRWD